MLGTPQQHHGFIEDATKTIGETFFNLVNGYMGTLPDTETADEYITLQIELMTNAVSALVATWDLKLDAQSAVIARNVLSAALAYVTDPKNPAGSLAVKLTDGVVTGTVPIADSELEKGLLH